MRKELTDDDKYIFLLGYKIKIRKKTKFENRKAEIIPRFQIKIGQWIKIKAKINGEGVLVAKTIRESRKRPLLISVRYDDSDNKIITTDNNSARTNPLKSFLEDESKGASFNLYSSENFLLGGKISASIREDIDRDFDKNKKKNKTINESGIRLDALWKYSQRGSFIFFEAGSILRKEESELKEKTKLSADAIYRAYTYIVVTDTIALQIGRQDFDEAREWIYDAIQDAARVYFVAGSFNAELSLSQGPKWSFAKNIDQNIRNLIINIRYKPHKKFLIGAWYVDREDTSKHNFNPRLYGIQVIRNPKKGMQYWLHAAQATGETGNLTLDGTGVDLGFSYIFKNRFRPYVFAGLAQGGGTDPSSNKGLFRQTGLQDNNDKFGGVTSYRYYGEVINPELTNIDITTFGIGFRPTPNFSFDTVFHQYRQMELSPILLNTRLKANPNGLSDDLGYEIDIVAGYRFRDLTLKLVLGQFTPGIAFNKIDPAKIGKLQFEYKF